MSGLIAEKIMVLGLAEQMILKLPLSKEFLRIPLTGHGVHPPGASP
jgi:hypothetical protein